MKNQMIDADTAAARIERGMAFLTVEYGQKWRSQIDRNKLDIAKYDQCIDGQLKANLFEAADCDASKLADLGFDLHPNEVHADNYATLTTMWKKALRN